MLTLQINKSITKNTSCWRAVVASIKGLGVFLMTVSLLIFSDQYYSLLSFSNTTPTNMTTSIISHRGAAGLAPENTLPAIQAGIDAGADYIEIDIHLTKDGELVVIHDTSVDRTTNGKGKISEMTLAEIKLLDAGSQFSPEFAGTRIPTLREALDVCVPSSSVLTIEVKKPAGQEAFVQELLQTLIDARAIEKVIIISFDIDFLRRLNERAPEIKTGDLYVFPPKKLPETKLVSLQYWSASLFKKRIRNYQAKGITVWAWTINNEKKAKRLVEKGLDGVVTDFPELLK